MSKQVALGLLLKIKKSSTFIRWTQWEYWPIAAFYFPVMPYYFILSIRAGHPFFYAAANPAIKDGGSGMESKYDTIVLLPKKWAPKTIHLKKGKDFSQVVHQLNAEKIDFPMIAKPDVGFRGLLVEKVNTLQELKMHIQQYEIDFIIQEFIESPIEFSVFYHKVPGEKKGEITSLTIKEFLEIKGDGDTSFGLLLEQKSRAKVILEDLKLRYDAVWHTVPPYGKKIKVVEIGNHARGAHFINGNHLIDDELLVVFEELQRNIPGWNYGRVDIRCESIEALKKGDFKIIEINGVLSEPTHIYDAAQMTYFKAVKDIAKHWTILYQVSTQNHKQNGATYPVFKEYIRSVKKLRRYIKRLR